MWTVLETKAAQKALAKAPVEVRENYTFWQNVVRLSGVAGLRTIKGFHDEALSGNRSGERSSRLNRKWRVLYTAHADVCEVHVVEVNAHDYR